MQPFTDIEEELVDQDEQLSQRVQRGVRLMEGRVDESYDDESAEDDEESDDQQPEDEAQQSEETQEEEPQPDDSRKSDNILFLFISGNVLVLSGLTKYYWQLVVIASIFLLSIIITFWSLHLDLEYNSLERDVQLLRERSVRMKEMRFTRCSQSAIIEELERRDIDLVNRTTPTTVIEEKSGFGGGLF